MLPPARFQNLLLACLALSSGAVDAISYLALGRVFTAFQTGNLVFLGLGLAGTGPGAQRPGRDAAVPLERSRLAGVLAGLLLGPAVGALLVTHVRVLAPAFPLAAIMLVVTACGWHQRRHPPVEDPSRGSP